MFCKHTLKLAFKYLKIGNIFTIINLQTKDLVRAYQMEVKMLEEGYIPESVEEHLKVSSRTSACSLLSCSSFIGMHDDVATEDCLDWVSSVPNKMVQSLSIILRLGDDL
jgi:hypothetical protein